MIIIINFHHFNIIILIVFSILFQLFFKFKEEELIYFEL